MRLILALLLTTTAWASHDTTIASDEVHYNGEQITLKGHVAVENAMGRVTAQEALLHKDEKKQTSIDFPWIELKNEVTLTLAEGGVLKCDSVFLDYTKKTGSLKGRPQLIYRDEMGEVYADRAEIDYMEFEGSLKATKVSLFDNVRLVNLGTSQYALADEVYYYPEEQVMLLEGKGAKVLFYDQLRDMQISANAIRAQRHRETKKESVQGIGDVRFVFKADELKKLKTRFELK